MVKICDTEYTTTPNPTYKSIFDKYPFELDHFQKYAIQGIEEGAHVLITSHTGSGKTLPSEYAIEKFCGEGKKVIYTAPIKSLSNQKFHEFTEKFPHISFGILTGDIKFNPDADCIIMTTEILRNTLFRESTPSTSNADSVSDIDPEKAAEMEKLSESMLQFKMDINELACVVFDEVHYINDADRGKVWEEAIIKLPQHTQMVMLSATIDRAEKFAKWIENMKDRPMWLASTNKRVVPLTHYSYFTLHKSCYKKFNDKEMEILAKQICDETHPIKDPINGFNPTPIEKLHKLRKYMYKEKTYATPYYVFNTLIEKLKKEDKLPAITFVFSRRKVLQYAKMIEKSLFNDTTEKHYPSLVDKACKDILRKLPNYEEYIHLPEYTQMVSLLEKGIAIHHSGIMPVLREMVELLFSKGFIKLLIATETFAVGINMPTKTVVFTSLTKYSNGGFRELLPHEYTQMAGRAGRRGLDTVGHVIHMNNVFDTPYTTTYKGILSGNPQTLRSKFSINYNLILRLLYNNISDHTDFVGQSILQNEVKEEIAALKNDYDALEKEISEQNFAYISTPLETLDQYHEMMSKYETAKNKQRKKMERQLTTIRDSTRSFEKDYKKYTEFLDKKTNLKELGEYIQNADSYVETSINSILNHLSLLKFVEKSPDKSTYTLSYIGEIASHIQELHPLVFGDALQNRCFDKLSTIEIVSSLACFVDFKVGDDYKSSTLSIDNYEVKNCVEYLKAINDKYYYNELKVFQEIDSNDYMMQFDLSPYIYQWCNAKDEETCKYILQDLNTKDVFMGTFVKSILKLNNIANELMNVAKFMNDVPFMYKLSKIPDMTLKYVVTNQSLYV